VLHFFFHIILYLEGLFYPRFSVLDTVTVTVTADFYIHTHTVVHSSQSLCCSTCL